MSLQALFGAQVSRIEDAKDIDELKRVLIDVLSSAAPIKLSTPLILDNRTNSPAIRIINTGRDGLQEVMHLHLHVMGGPRPWLKG